MYDIFISYRRDGGFEMARLLYDRLHDMGLNVFFDLEELRSGKFNVKLFSAIDESANFLLVLPKDSLDRCKSEDDWLRIEIEYAIAKKKNIVPLMMNGFTWPSDLPETLKGLHLYNAVQMSREYLDASIERILSMCVNMAVKGGKKASAEKDVREGNKYFTYDDKKERRRLNTQQNLMRSFDAPAYDKVKGRYEKLTVLDLGANTGEFIMDRLGTSENLEKLVGVEFDEKAVQYANATYGKAGKIAFFRLDLESETFYDDLRGIMDENGISSFNVINLSMVLLHLKHPYRLLKGLRGILSKDGTIIVKDIDDGMNMAYPDDDGIFAKAVDICNREELAGYRKSGRQVYTLLYRSGFKHIIQERFGLSVAGMDSDERSALFDTYFSFILEDLRILREKYPDDKRIKADLEWYEDMYDDLEEKFQDDAFYFVLGFMLFTAQK